MEISDTKKAYKAPLVKALKVSVLSVLCQSDPSGDNTEKYHGGSYSFDGDDIFE